MTKRLRFLNYLSHDAILTIFIMSNSKLELYVYDLSEQILNSLSLVHFDLSIDTLIESISEKNQLKATKDDDFTKFNKKRESQGLPKVTEEQYEEMLENSSIGSLSGSDSELGTDEEDEEDSMYKRLSETQISDVKSDETSTSFLNSKTPMIYFKSPEIPETKQLGVYKNLFTGEEIMNPKASLANWQETEKAGKSALFMLGGGHFAGAIVSHKRKNIKGIVVNKKVPVKEQLVDVIKSKTFHRYTTRRKQGGSQSANDNSKGNAKSVGSNIRRQMEQTLVHEIRQLLQDWKTDLQGCQSIFIRANGSQGRKTFMGYEGAVLDLKDPRIKSFPFSTKRATSSEVKRAWSLLSYAPIIDNFETDESLKKKMLQQEEILLKSQQQKQKKKVEVSESDKHTSELIGFAKRQKAPMIINYLKKNKLEPDFSLTPSEHYKHTPNLLHFASSQGLTHVIQVLLVNLKIDPTIKNAAGKVAAELSTDKHTKRSFQVARKILGEEFCDWGLAKVGPGMTKEEVVKEEQEEAEKIKAEKHQQIQEELNKKTELELKKPTFSNNGKLGGASLISSTGGLSDEQKMRVMREQRARAAEARFKKVQGNS